MRQLKPDMGGRQETRHKINKCQPKSQLITSIGYITESGIIAMLFKYKVSYL